MHKLERETTPVKTYSRLLEAFSTYNTKNLVDVSPELFEQTIRSKIGKVDATSEGYSEEEVDAQRDLTIMYHWGHDHDFGTFKLDGRMGVRHLKTLSNFIESFPISIRDFREKSIFDIGCWTGGTSLLLAAISEKVLAIEEVKKYADTVNYLARSFGVSGKISAEAKSIYSCNNENYFDRFDIAYFPGVIYHLSDPLLALRILYNSLKIDGFILIESAGLNTDEPICRFDGSKVWQSGTKEEMNRGGWNWFIPSPSALQRMMIEAGFEEVQTLWHESSRRVYGFGRKLSQRSICKAGLSVQDLR